MRAGHTRRIPSRGVSGGCGACRRRDWLQIGAFRLLARCEGAVMVWVLHTARWGFIIPPVSISARRETRPKACQSRGKVGGGSIPGRWRHPHRDRTIPRDCPHFGACFLAGKQAAGRPVGPANDELRVLSYEWRREVLGGSWLVISGGGDSPCAGARECDSMRAPPPEEGEK